MSEYVYVPDDDSEFGPVWEASEAREYFTPDELADAAPAEPVVSLDGWRGHYLAAAYLSEAADLVETDDMPERGVETIAEWRKASDAYDKHGGYGCGPTVTLPSGDNVPGLCEYCENIHEIADEAESVLGDLGYITQWNDGVSVWKVGE